LIRQNGITLVHVHNFFPLLTFSVFKSAKRAGAVVVHTLHNYRWWCAGAELYRKDNGVCELCVHTGHSLHAIRYGCYRNSRWQSMFAVLILSLARKRTMFHYIDYFIVLSSFQQCWVTSQGIPSHKVILKPNWVEYCEPVSVEHRRGFVFVGRLEPSKGVESLLKCWVDNAISVPLILIGSGSLEQMLREKYKLYPHIHFMGACSQQETLTLIGRSKYLIHPSLWYETFGLTLVEAMQQGVPVIGYAIGTRLELIEDGVNGFLCQPNTLAQTIEKALSFCGYDQLSANAIKSAHQFTRESLALKQVQFYRTWVQRKYSPIHQ
jgi:glycosyltransferase involved in cell wall biosynthesis